METKWFLSIFSWLTNRSLAIQALQFDMRSSFGPEAIEPTSCCNVHRSIVQVFGTSHQHLEDHPWE